MLVIDSLSFTSQFVEGPMMEGLYWDAWYDTARTSVNKHEQNILYENRLLGVPRMRQVRQAVRQLMRQGEGRDIAV